MAEPIVQQNLAGDGAEHQALLDRLHGVLDGAWKWLESYLPEHDLKSQALDGVKAAYDNAAAVIKSDYAILKAQGVQLAGEAVADVKEDVATGVTQAEGVVESAASAVASQAASSTSSTSSTASGASTASAPSAPSSSASGSPSSSTGTASS